MERQHPDQQNSSLGISKVLQKDIEAGDKQAMTDDMFKVPHKGSNVFIWTRFIISLYYNKVIKKIKGKEFIIKMVFRLLLVCLALSLVGIGIIGKEKKREEKRREKK
jgi:hypothetical protein